MFLYLNSIPTHLLYCGMKVHYREYIATIISINIDLNKNTHLTVQWYDKTCSSFIKDTDYLGETLYVHIGKCKQLNRLYLLLQEQIGNNF